MILCTPSPNTMRLTTCLEDRSQGKQDALFKQLDPRLPLRTSRTHFQRCQRMHSAKLLGECPNWTRMILALSSVFPKRSSLLVREIKSMKHGLTLSCLVERSLESSLGIRQWRLQTIPPKLQPE